MWNKLAVLAFVCAPWVAGAEETAPERWVPASVVASLQVSHPAPRLPRDWLAANPGVEQVQGMYRVCLGDDGTVAAVSPMRRIDGADAAIALQIAENWRYQVGGVCFASLLKFQISEPSIHMGPPTGGILRGIGPQIPRHR